jgi:hypothetical protein
MGTRSITYVYEDGKKLMAMYRQMDGYPSGHGLELAKFLDGMVVVNGFGSDTPSKAANGIGCLAAQLISEFKDGIGGIYITPTTAKDNEDYGYHLYSDMTVKVTEFGKKIFAGSVAEFKTFCENTDD